MPKPFAKGNKGKPKGATNKLTRTVKEVFTNVFEKMQGDPNVKLETWGKENPTEFYRLCAKLIPAAVDVTSNGETFNAPQIILNK